MTMDDVSSETFFFIKNEFLIHRVVHKDHISFRDATKP